MSEKQFGFRIYGDETSADFFIFQEIPEQEEIIKSLRSQAVDFQKKFAVLIQKEGERIHSHKVDDGSNNPFKAFIFKRKDDEITSLNRSYFFINGNPIKNFNFRSYKVITIKVK